jgi:uncharacterized protein (DUF2252 family)
VVRELLPQDFKVELDHKVELDRMTRSQAIEPATRRAWRDELGRKHPGDLDAPSWLWQSVADQLVDHERTYLDHCRVFAHERDAGS